MCAIQESFVKMTEQDSSDGELSDKDKMFKTVLTQDVILERSIDFVNHMKQKQSNVCTKYRSNVANLSSIPVDMFEVFEMLCCDHCGLPEDEHKPCSFFSSKYECSTCGLGEHVHIPCDEPDINSRDYCGKCTKCGTTKHRHDKYNAQHNKCCFSYSSNGKRQCTTCRFDVNAHVWNEQMRNLPENL